jgi:pyoverdine/dityrosine biosynthesis protein Dit1
MLWMNNIRNESSNPAFPCKSTASQNEWDETSDLIG